MGQYREFLLHLVKLLETCSRIGSGCPWRHHPSVFFTPDFGLVGKFIFKIQKIGTVQEEGLGPYKILVFLLF